MSTLLTSQSPLLSHPLIHSLSLTPLELTTLASLTCPITHCLLTNPVTISGTPHTIESEYRIFISAKSSLFSSQTPAAEYLNALHLNYPQLRDIPGVRYLPTFTTRQFMRHVKRNEIAQVIGIIEEFRGEFLYNVRLYKRLVKETHIMKRIENLQRDIAKQGRHIPGLKWGNAAKNANTQMDMDLNSASGVTDPYCTPSKYIVPASHASQPSTYCHWLHYIFENGTEEMALAILEELSSMAQRRERLVELLLDASTPTKPVSPFIYALWTCKSLRVVKRLVAIIGDERLNEAFPSKDDIETPTKKQHRDRLNMHLIKAIIGKNIALVHLLLRFGADVMAYVDEVQATPLNYACRKNLPQMALVLVENGADVNQVMDMTINAINYRPLHYAVQENAKDLVMALVDRGAPLNVVSTFESNIDMTPLAVAVQNDNYHTVEYLLAKGASPDAPPESKIAAIPVHLAIQNENDEILRLLLSHGASVLDALDTKGRNVLHHAAMQNNIDVARVLLEVDEIREELINAPDYSGYTPLHYASQHEDMVVARELIASDKSGKITSTLRTQVHKNEMGLPPRALVEEDVSMTPSAVRRASAGKNGFATTSTPLHRASPMAKNSSTKKRNSSSRSTTPQHQSQKAPANSAGPGSIHFLRERVAQLKKKISEIQIQHAAEVEDLESQVHTMKSIAKTHYKQHARLLNKVKSPQNGGLERVEEPVVEGQQKRPRSAVKRSSSVRRSLSQSRSTTPVHAEQREEAERPSTASSAARRAPSSTQSKRPASSYSPSPSRALRSTSTKRASIASPVVETKDTPNVASTADEKRTTLKRKSSYKDVKPKVNSHRSPARQRSPVRAMSPLVRHTGSRHASPAPVSKSPVRSRSPVAANSRTLSPARLGSSGSVPHPAPTHKSPARQLPRTNDNAAVQKPVSSVVSRSFSRSFSRSSSPARGSASTFTPTKTQQPTPTKLFSPSSSNVQSRSPARARVNSNNTPQDSKFGTLTQLNKTTFAWAIPRSVAIHKKYQEAILSKVFSCFGQSWRLKVYPRGAVDDGMVSFYIMQDGGDYDSYEYTLDYSVEMINTVVPQQEDFRARNTFRKGEISWGWAHYCASNEVLDVDRGYTDETGHIVFHVNFLNMNMTATEPPAASGKKAAVRQSVPVTASRRSISPSNDSRRVSFSVSKYDEGKRQEENQLNNSADTYEEEVVELSATSDLSAYSPFKSPQHRQVEQLNKSLNQSGVSTDVDTEDEEHGPEVDEEDYDEEGF